MRHLFLLFFIRLWLLVGWWSRAAKLLASYLETSHNAALHWKYLAIIDHLDLPLEVRLHAYHRAVHVDPDSPRTGPAWFRIGQMEEEREQGLEASAAYLQAERLGCTKPVQTYVRPFELITIEQAVTLGNH